MDEVGVEGQELAAAPARRVSRILWAGRQTARWVAYFTVSFALTAGVLLLAHI
jgi:hypothetical protein